MLLDLTLLVTAANAYGRLTRAQFIGQALAELADTPAGTLVEALRASRLGVDASNA